MIQVDNSTFARPRATAQPTSAESKPRVLENLKTTNEAMVGQIAADVMEFSRHPLQSLQAMAKGMVFPLIHPIKMAKSLAADIQEDPLAGSLNAAAVASGVAFVGAVLAIGVGVVAAPVTGGASLALAASAASLTTPIALACLAVDGAAIAMHQVRGALADSEEEARQQGEEMAGWVEDAALNVASWVVGDAVQAKLFDAQKAASLVKSLGDATNNTIGLAGIYDLPEGSPPASSVPVQVPRLHRFVPDAGGDQFDLSPKARQALGFA